MKITEAKNTMSMHTLQRLPLYLSVLKKCRDTDKASKISSTAIAKELGLVDIQVRKDLASVSDKGKPKIGYLIDELIADIEAALGYNNINDAVLVGAGKLGQALLSYKGFKEYGLNIVAAFDTDDNIVGKEVNGITILHLDKLTDLCRRIKIHIGIITVPQQYAQSVSDLLVAGGIKAIWNFAPTHLKTSDEIMVRSENMAASLAVLSKHLSEKYLVRR